MRTMLIISLTALVCAASGQPSNAPTREPAPAITRKKLPERYYVLEAALRFMLNGHSLSNRVEQEVFSAYVLPKGGEFTPELVAAFAGHKPLVTAGIKVSTKSGAARDEATGKRVKLWSGEVTEIRGEQATARVSWYVSPLGAEGYVLQLRRKNGKWEVESAKSEWIS